MKKQYNAIDLFKLLMAVCVVAIHTHPLENLYNFRVNEIYNSVINMAVPFFFLASGYLLATKLKYPFTSSKDITTVRAFMLKMIKLYILWNIIYLPLAIYEYIKNNISFINAVILYLRDLIFVGQHYNSWMLWYLLSTIYALGFIIYFLKKKLSIKYIVLIGLGVLLISFVFDFLSDYNGRFFLLEYIGKAINYTVPNGRILRGGAFIPVGMYLSYKELSKSVRWIFFISGFVLNCFIKNEFISNILLFICSVGLFNIVKNINLKDHSIYFVMRKMSTSIYFIHLYVWTLFYKVVYGQKTYGFKCFIATLLISAVISLVYAVFCNIIKNRRTN